MKILALEFSSEQRSVAVAVGAPTGGVEIRGSASELGGRSTRAIALVEAALQQAGIDRLEIDCIAVGVGPGSYTGIRAAIALTQGWQLAKAIKVLAISSVETIANSALADRAGTPINVVVDAQRNEFYWARYEAFNSTVIETEKLRLVPFSEVEAKAKRGEKIAGPDAKPFGGEVLFPDARILARIAAERTDFIPAEKLEPIYLRETTFVKAPPPRTIP